MLSRFRKDPYVILRYNAANVVLGWTILGALWLLVPSAFHFSPYWLLSFSVFLIPEFFTQLIGSVAILAVFAVLGGFDGRPYLFAVLAFSVPFAFFSGVLMHNTAHRNVRPRWLNRVVGELCGFQQLGGYVVWTLVHMVHHRYPDDPTYDPHPPGNKSFAAYIRTSFNGLITCMNRLYRDTWTAKDPKYARIWVLTGTVGATARFTRLLLLLVLLRPSGFVCFAVPAYAVLTLLYWHFNYSTHQPNEAGVIEIRNVEHNAYYRFVNRYFAGFYFHRTHHEKPYLFNPAKEPAAAVRKRSSSSFLA